MHEIAANRNGKCLSSFYQGTKHKLLWECQKGHTWEATPESIFRAGTWCLTCIGRKS
ncbi:zinc-ribbon domain-containing protein [Dulcicalothrix desertica]|uniref:zinc-ribbon domain-containing protein n=1 Tax=Dulcicalothrix desertica TaxID=32056 RepID=UPI000F8F3488